MNIISHVKPYVIFCNQLQAKYLVAERTLFLWNNDHIENLIKQNRKVILPIIFPALERNARHHWNQAVHSLTLNVSIVSLEEESGRVCLYFTLGYSVQAQKENSPCNTKNSSYQVMVSITRCSSIQSDCSYDIS
ncbi:hypothetical protein Leryth_021520 [Lithospermum erythrorhizon]|nr:hypothetical protein Leryth_021520 [Lithospermum erythrorhizon]